MKKLLLIGVVCLLAFASHAQTVPTATRMLNPNGFAVDTASQAAAEGPALIVKGYAKTVGIVIKTLKISGTIAGTITIQVSNDGVNYASLGSPITLVDASTNYSYSVVDKPFLYYKALITQTGTSSLSYQGYLLAGVPKP